MLTISAHVQFRAATSSWIERHLYRMSLPATATTPAIEAVAPLPRAIIAVVRNASPAMIPTASRCCPGLFDGDGDDHGAEKGEGNPGDDDE